MGRPRTFDLTDQQAHVLELIAKGQTNYEIAEALGLSLEGAKYHIRQVFDKLGVDSREEAVAAWRESHGALARLRALLWPIGALAAGGMAAVAGVVVAVVLATGGSSNAVSAMVTVPTATASPTPAGAVWIAEIVPNPGSDGPGPIGQLEVYKAGERADAHVFSDFTVQGNSIAWSPDGKHLAVQVILQDRPETNYVPSLFIFSRTPSGWTQARLGFQAGWFGWSPDGDVLAASNGPHAMLIAPSGKVLEQTTVQSSNPEHGAAIWSPDKKVAAVGYNGALALLSRSGAHVYHPPDAQCSGLIVDNWVGASALHVTCIELPAPPPGDPRATATATATSGHRSAPVYYEVQLDGSQATWKALAQPLPVPTNPMAVFLSQPVPASVLAALHEPSGITVNQVGVTADGTSKVFVPGIKTATPSGPPIDYRIAVEMPSGQVVTADLGNRVPYNTRYNMSFGAVVTTQPG